MTPLSANDIESELSYAYLHAVASHAGAGCKWGNRHDDNHGIDAQITGWSPFPGGGTLQEVDLKIQLKATKAIVTETATHFSYFLQGINRYNDLRSDALATHRILVVMFLPADANHWLDITHSELILKKCAYWVSLRGAAASANDTGETVYVPKAQIFNPDNLKEIFGKVSRFEVLNYQIP